MISRYEKLHISSQTNVWIFCCANTLLHTLSMPAFFFIKCHFCEFLFLSSMIFVMNQCPCFYLSALWDCSNIKRFLDSKCKLTHRKNIKMLIISIQAIWHDQIKGGAKVIVLNRKIYFSLILQIRKCSKLDMLSLATRWILS